MTQTAWALWTDNHPDTLILDKQGGYRGDSYHYYYRDGQKGVLGESNEDNRLAPKELVVGVSLDGDTKAYPLEALRSQPTVNDSVGGNEVLVFLEINTETALVYDRRVDAMALTFRLLPGGGARPLLMDDETGSTWMALTGLAIDGPLKGAALNRSRPTSASGSPGTTGTRQRTSSSHPALRGHKSASIPALSMSAPDTTTTSTADVRSALRSGPQNLQSPSGNKGAEAVSKTIPQCVISARSHQ